MKTTEAQGLSTVVLSLPEMAMTRDGGQFFPVNQLWKIPGPSRTVWFSFQGYEDFFSDELLYSLKLVFVHYLQTHSLSHSGNLYERAKHFFSYLAKDTDSLSHITSAQILSYRSQLPADREWYLGSLSGFFKQWYDMGYPGVHKDVPRLFNEIKIKGNQKGNAVRTMDPDTGPFDDMELQAIHTALNNAFAQGDIGVHDFVLVNLFTALGARPIQIAALKCKDLMVGRSDDGTPTYILNIPSAKKRAEQIRTSFKPRPLIREIGEALEAWINYLKKINPAETDDTGDLPIFPDWWANNVPGLEHHLQANELSLKLSAVCSILGVTSHRTGDPIKINPRRFRYTLGTRAAQEGHGELLIAELLDHSDTQNVGVYVEATPAIAERIDKATALELAPIAQAFCGMIVDDEAKAKRGDDLTSRIGSPEIGNVGTCGRFGFCGGMAPVACYTCRNFQPWLDAPHEELLDSLLQERERLLETTGDERFASINDRTIMAVADVVMLCQSTLEERGG
ncbi:site-specific integrase [Terasakiella sp.]|uniref:site-specific integrase n=1 Tax=Terasakiella sp. TaxID=2034861 RepID=UPI003AA87811